MITHIKTCCPKCGRMGRSSAANLGNGVACRHCGEEFALSRFIRFDCPVCLRNLRIPPSLFGREVVCKYCSATFRIDSGGEPPLALPSSARRPSGSVLDADPAETLNPLFSTIEDRVGGVTLERDKLIAERDALASERLDDRTRLEDEERTIRELSEARTALERELARKVEEIGRFTTVAESFAAERLSLQTAFDEERRLRALDRDESESRAGEIAEARDRIDQLERALREAESRNEANSSELAALALRLTETENLRSKTLAEAESRELLFNELQKRADGLEARLSASDREAEARSSEVESLRASLNEAEACRLRLEIETESRSAELLELQARASRLEETIAEVIDEREPLVREILRQRETADELRGDSRSIRTRLEQTLAERDAAVCRLDGLNEECQRLSAMALELQANRRTAEQELRNEIERWKEEWKQADRRLLAADRTAGETLGELLGLRAEVVRQERLIQYERDRYCRSIVALREELESVRGDRARRPAESAESEDEFGELYRDVALCRRLFDGSAPARKSIDAPG